MKSFKEYFQEERSSLTEASLGRLNQHFEQGDAIAIISAEKDENDKATNSKNTNELRKIVLGYKFGFNKALGGYVEVSPDGNKKEVVGEKSTIIYASPDREKELEILAKKLGKKFNQNSILFVDAKKNAKWIYTTDVKDPEGKIVNKAGEIEPLGRFVPKQLGDYFTKIGKKNFTFLVQNEDYERFSDTNGEIRLSSVSEATTFEVLRKDLAKQARELLS